MVIGDSNGIIKMGACRQISNSSIIVVECMTLRYGILATKGFLNLNIEGDSKIVIDCYNKNINIPSSILLLMKDIWKSSQDLNIYVCQHVYRETNRTTNCLARKGLIILDSNILWSNFPKDVTYISFEDCYIYIYIYIYICLLEYVSNFVISMDYFFSFFCKE